MSKKIAPTVERKPPDRVPQSKQYDLFAEFYGKEHEHSNTIELWDAIPKYSVTARRQSSIRDEQGRLPVHEYGFVYNKHRCRLEVQPASIKVGGKFRDFYPSADEELVEEILRKFFSDQKYGMHDAGQGESWVRFSLSMIRRELRERGKTRSIDEIKRSIEILARTTVALYRDEDDTPVYVNPILSDLTRVNRDRYLDDPGALWVARLPALVSKSVNELTYRQFNYGVFMSLTGQLTRWLHKRLSHQFLNASLMNSYDILYSTLCRDSGLLTANRITKNTKALAAALDELVAADVLLSWSKEERRGERNALTDVLYHLTPTPSFVSDVKAANARQRDARETLGSSGGAQGGRRSGQKVVGGRGMK